MNTKFLKLGLNALKQNIFYKIDTMFNSSISKPIIVCLQLNDKCNFRCKQCGLWRAKSKELTSPQWKKILLNLRNWIGPFYISISGGEPFLRKDLFEIIKFSNKIGIITDVTTNGSLINKELAEKIIGSDLDKIIFSLDGAISKTHDEIRSFKGAFSRAINAIKILQSLTSNLNISINTVITNKNLNELEDMVKLVVNNNLNSISFRTLIFSDVINCYSNKNYFDNHSKSSLWPKDYEKVCRAIDRLIKLKSLGYPIANSIKHLKYMKQYFQNPFIEYTNLKCSHPLQYLSILPDGRISICSKDTIGDVSKNKPQGLWYSDEALKIRRQRRRCHRSCMLRNPLDTRDSLIEKFQTFYVAFKKNKTEIKSRAR